MNLMGQIGFLAWLSFCGGLMLFVLVDSIANKGGAKAVALRTVMFAINMAGIFLIYWDIRRHVMPPRSLWLDGKPPSINDAPQEIPDVDRARKESDV